MNNQNPCKQSERIGRLKASPIRDILQALNKPGMISFAGGLPDPESFPDLNVDDLNINDYLQYGATEGEYELRQCVAQQMVADGIPTEPERVLILSGSQQGIDLVAKLMIDPGTEVGVQTPTYLAALQVLSLFGARYVPLALDATGARFPHGHPSLLYINPTFQNPTGAVMNLNERMKVARLCESQGTVLFEDDPYRELQYESCDRTPICGLVRDTPWIYQSSFSKTVAPGLRIGFMTCSESLYPSLQRLKQASDLHTSRLGQALALQVMKDPAARQRLTQLRERYRKKRDRFDESLHRHFGDIAEWQRPAGGLFFWLKLDGSIPIDTQQLMAEALEHNVAFMPGESFHAVPQTGSYLRLNFSHANEQQTEQGLATLANLIKKKLNQNNHSVPDLDQQPIAATNVR